MQYIQCIVIARRPNICFRAFSASGAPRFQHYKVDFNKKIIKSFEKIASDWYVGLGPTPARIKLELLVKQRH
jgi:hypothetical protein